MRQAATDRPANMRQVTDTPDLRFRPYYARRRWRRLGGLLYVGTILPIILTVADLIARFVSTWGLRTSDIASIVGPGIAALLALLAGWRKDDIIRIVVPDIGALRRRFELRLESSAAPAQQPLDQSGRRVNAENAN
jgi:hypothetical protein